MATIQNATDYPPRRRRTSVAQGPREGLSDAHQSHSTRRDGEPVAAPFAFRRTARKNPRTRGKLNRGDLLLRGHGPIEISGYVALVGRRGMLLAVRSPCTRRQTS